MHVKSLPRRNGHTRNVRPNSGCQAYAIAAKRKPYVECRLFCQPHQDRFLGWDGLLPVHQATGARPIPLAGKLRDGWHRDAEFVPALDADRGGSKMPPGLTMT